MTNKEKAQELYEQGLDLLEDGDIQGSLPYFEKAYKLDSETLEIIESLAIVSNLAGDKDKAIELFGIITKRFPDYLYPYLTYLNLLMDTNNIDLAFDVFDMAEKAIIHAIEDEESDPEIFLLGANIYYQMEFIDEAMMLLYRGMKKFPKNLDFYKDMLVIYYELEIYDEAIKVAGEALKITRKEPTIYLYYGLSLQKLNYVHDALKALNRSYELDSNQAELKKLILKLEEITSRQGNTIEEIIKDSKPKKKYRGIVKWFDEEKGIGSIKSKEIEGNIFLHYSSIRMDGFQTVSENTEVEFTVRNTEKGLIAIQVTLPDSPQTKRYVGEVADFDIRTGLGIIISDELGEIYFHYSGLIDRIIKISESGEKVTFSTFSVEGYTQAFNIKGNEKTKNSDQLESLDTYTGTLKWFDDSVGYGIIETDDGIEMIVQKGQLPVSSENIKDGTKLTFDIDEIEAITGEKVPRAINIRLLDS